jgi:hypothetical protein
LLAATLYQERPDRNNKLWNIYPIELEIKDTTYTNRSVSYLDQHLEIDSETKEMISIFPL